MNNYHVSVLLQEVIDFLQIKPGEKYIDATLGGGGHTFGILSKGGKVLAIDVDQEALNEVEDKVKSQKLKVKSEGNLRLARANFRDIERIAKENNYENIAGILFDFGVSSHQIDNPDRGFSFSKNGPLDMRMDDQLSVTAKDLVNGLHKDELIEVFTRFGEERFGHGIATEIVNMRKEKLIETTQELTNIIDKVIPARLNRTAAAARIFQSLRILVNDELHAIEEAIPGALKILHSKGRIVVISFHSLEDRIVKHTFADFETHKLGEVITKQPVLATEQEIAQNVRSRSAKLRVFAKE